MSEEADSAEGYSFRLEIHEITRNYLAFRLEYPEGFTSGALTLDEILTTFRDVVKGVMTA